MTRIVIAAYKPKPGQESDLLQLTAQHLPLLRAEGLTTGRPGVTMQAADGTLIAVFEWVSAQAIELAHANPAVQALWRRYGEVCEYIPLAAVPEAATVFPDFTPVSAKQLGGS